MQHGTGQQDKLFFGQTRKVLDGHQGPCRNVEHRAWTGAAEKLRTLQDADLGGGRVVVAYVALRDV